MKPHTETRWANIHTRPDGVEFFGGMLTWRKCDLPQMEINGVKSRKVRVLVTEVKPRTRKGGR